MVGLPFIHLALSVVPDGRKQNSHERLLSLMKHLHRITTTAILAVVITALTTFASAQVSRTAPDLVPTGKGWGEASSHSNNAKTARPRPSGNGISWHGGPLMLGTPNIYYIWYGNWAAGGSNSATSQTILTNFISNLGGSGYEHINATYCQASTCTSSTANVSGQLTYVKAASDSYSQGTSFGDAGVQAIVANAISSGKLPKDTNGLYFVLTSSDVNETSGFCTQYCGWHTHGTISGSDIKYSFVGNPDRCPSACEAQTTSPNSDSGADGMASIIAHESEEAISDPDLNAWYDTRGAENADKCAWTFGTESTASNGSKYNITLAGGQYLIQQNWVNANGGFCAMSF